MTSEIAIRLYSKTGAYDKLMNQVLMLAREEEVDWRLVISCWRFLDGREIGWTVGPRFILYTEGRQRLKSLSVSLHPLGTMVLFDLFDHIQRNEAW